MYALTLQRGAEPQRGAELQRGPGRGGAGDARELLRERSKLARGWRSGAWALSLVACLTLVTACEHEPRVGAGSIEALPSYRDPALLARAWELPVAAAYRRAGLVSQQNGSTCGPATVVNALASLGARPDTERELLDRHGLGTFGVLAGGLTLDELATLVRSETPRKVEVIRDLDLPGLERLLALSNDPEQRLLVNLARAPLFGRGGGHHSPIGGYLEHERLVLVLDVNGEYGPWLVPVERLLAAIDTVDGTSGKKRGLILIGPVPAPAPRPAAPPAAGP